MADEGSEYKSIEEVRSVLYPRGAALLDLEKEDVLEFPANLALAGPGRGRAPIGWGHGPCRPGQATR
jgi:hypothetical protein